MYYFIIITALPLIAFSFQCHVYGMNECVVLLLLLLLLNSRYCWGLNHMDAAEQLIVSITRRLPTVALSPPLSLPLFKVHNLRDSPEEVLKRVRLQ